MSTEVGLLLHKTHEAREAAWGRHCEWPPRWVKIPPETAELTRDHPYELAQIYQSLFQQAVMRALRELFGFDVESMTLEDLMEQARVWPFWIGEDGVPRFFSSPLWE